MSKNKVFVFFSVAFLWWLFLNNIFQNFYKTILILLFLVVFLLLYYIIKRKYLIFIIFFIIWFILWTVYSSYYSISINNKILLVEKHLDWDKTNILMEVKSLYKKEDFQNKYKTKLLSVNWKKITNNIYSITTIPSNLTVKKWYIIRSNVKLYSIKNIWYTDYKSYFYSNNIFFNTFVNDFSLEWENSINFYYRSLENLRNWFLTIINKIYTKNEAIFLWWILLWSRESIPDDVKTNFNNSWLTHFIAVSWFNITILIIFFSYIFSYLPIFLRMLLISTLVVSFAILVWDTMPVIRATIMWLIWYFIIISWRKWDSLAIILFTTIIISIFSPLSINYDISFHLSFLAVLGIIYTHNFFERIFFFLPKAFAIKEAFILTLSSLSFTLPIIIFNFWQISVLSPLANVLVAWTIPFAMLLWFLSIIVYFIFPYLWIVIGYFTWVLLKWDMIVVEYFGQSKWAIVEFDSWILKNYFQILYFVILLFLIIYFRQDKKEIRQ